MTAPSLFSIIGLGLDIVGAILLAKGTFFEDIKLTVDRSSQKEAQYHSQNMANIIYVGGADRIIQRCRDIFYSRIGLMLLCFGFLLQIYSQWLPNNCYFGTKDWLITAVTLFLLIFIIALVAIEMDKKTRIEGLDEYLNRILPSYGGVSGRDWEINEQIVRKFMGKDYDPDFLAERQRPKKK